MKKITESLAIKYDKRTQLQGVINSSNNEIIPCECEAIFYVQKYNQLNMVGMAVFKKGLRRIIRFYRLSMGQTRKWKKSKSIFKSSKY